MQASFNVFIVGTKERPTTFLMQSGELVDCIEDAMIHMSRKEAENEIAKCDGQETFRVYEGKVIFKGL